MHPADPMFTMTKYVRCGMLTVWAALSPGATVAAPQPLYGKSVVVTWSETRLRKAGAQPAASTFTRHGDFSVYVSSAGRVFNRLTYSGFTQAPRRYLNFQSASSDQVGGQGSSQRNVAFSGRTMTSITPMNGGAQRILVTFADDFSTCSAQVLTGKSTG